VYLVNQSFLVLGKYIMDVSCMFESVFKKSFSILVTCVMSVGVVGHMFERFFLACLSFDACTWG
jgi:hypothetical protein